MRLVNWRRVNAYFCGAIWLVALVLVVVIMVHAFPDSGVSVHFARPVMR